MSFCTTTAPATVAKKAVKSCRPEGGTEEIGPGQRAIAQSTVAAESASTPEVVGV
jgi:hypothetical protein